MDPNRFVRLPAAVAIILGLFSSLSSYALDSATVTVAVEVASNRAGAGTADDWGSIPSEASHGLGAVDCASLDDPDLDGLSNWQEIAAGTDPNDSDTDGGEENDGSEVLLFGTDPLDPADDEIQRIRWVHARPGISCAVLTFAVRPEYQHLRLYRRTLRGLGYDLVDSSVAPTGFYVDSGLLNGFTYHYRLMAVDDEGHRSRVTSTIQASPPGRLRAFLPLMQG